VIKRVSPERVSPLFIHILTNLIWYSEISKTELIVCQFMEQLLLRCSDH